MSPSRTDGQCRREPRGMRPSRRSSSTPDRRCRAPPLDTAGCASRLSRSPALDDEARLKMSAPTSALTIASGASGHSRVRDEVAGRDVTRYSRVAPAQASQRWSAHHLTRHFARKRVLSFESLPFRDAIYQHKRVLVDSNPPAPTWGSDASEQDLCARHAPGRRPSERRCSRRYSRLRGTERGDVSADAAAVPCDDNGLMKMPRV